LRQQHPRQPTGAALPGRPGPSARAPASGVLGSLGVGGPSSTIHRQSRSECVATGHALQLGSVSSWTVHHGQRHSHGLSPQLGDIGSSKRHRSVQSHRRGRPASSSLSACCSQHRRPRHLYGELVYRVAHGSAGANCGYRDRKWRHKPGQQPRGAFVCNTASEVREAVIDGADAGSGWSVKCDAAREPGMAKSQ